MDLNFLLVDYPFHLYCHILFDIYRLIIIWSKCVILWIRHAYDITSSNIQNTKIFKAFNFCDTRQILPIYHDILQIYKL